MYKTTLSVLSLIAVAAAYESTEDYCKVIYEGEIRSVYEPSKCLDIANADGKGGMGTYHCDGLDDQYFYHCDDGTIRNRRNNYCVTPQEWNGTGDLYSEACEFITGLPPRQQWFLPYVGTMWDAGIDQDVYEFNNNESKQCMDLDYTDLTPISENAVSARAQTFECHGGANQQFYFRNRGKLLQEGLIKNLAHNQCIDDLGRNVPCQNISWHKWRYYENGEFVNVGNGKCLDVANLDGYGKVATYYCEAFPDQRWALHNNQYFLNLANINNCLISPCRDCDSTCEPCPFDEQSRYEFMAATWSSTTSNWRQVACNQGGSIKMELYQGMSQTISESQALEISISMTNSVEVFGAESEIETGLAYSIEQGFEESWDSSINITQECTYNPDDSPFLTGCMWQYATHTQDNVTGAIYDYQTPYVTCTEGSAQPKCPPLMEAQPPNGDDYQCVEW